MPSKVGKTTVVEPMGITENFQSKDRKQRVEALEIVKKILRCIEESSKPLSLRQISERTSLSWGAIKHWSKIIEDIQRSKIRIQVMEGGVTLVGRKPSE